MNVAAEMALKEHIAKQISITVATTIAKILLCVLMASIRIDVFVTLGIQGRTAKQTSMSARAHHVLTERHATIRSVLISVTVKVGT